MTQTVAPDANNYLVGGGQFYWDEKSGSTFLGELDMGNIINPNLSKNIDELEHFTSRSGTRRRDKVIVTSSDIALSFNIDEITEDNMNIFLFGNGVNDFTQTGGSISDEQITVYDNRWVRMANRKVSAVVVGDDATPTTTYVLDTDYELDTEIGRIFVLPDGAITDGQTVFVDYTAAALISTDNWKTIFPLTDLTREGRARFIFKSDIHLNSDNQETVMEWIIPNAELRADGEFGLNSDSWSEIPFTLRTLEDTTSLTEPFGVFLFRDEA